LAVAERSWLIALVVIAAGASYGLQGPRPAMAQGPELPATFYGEVTLDGGVPPPGTDIRAFVNGNDCTQEGDDRFILVDGQGRYVITVVHLTQREGCGMDGATVRFFVGGRLAAQTGTWRNDGPQELDLAAAGAPVTVTAPAGSASSAPPAGTATPTGTDAQPSGEASMTAAATAASATASTGGTMRPTPGPPAEPATRDGGDSPWPWIAAGVGGAAALGAAGWYVARRGRAVPS